MFRATDDGDVKTKQITKGEDGSYGIRFTDPNEPIIALKNQHGVDFTQGFTLVGTTADHIFVRNLKTKQFVKFHWPHETLEVLQDTTIYANKDGLPRGAQVVSIDGQVKDSPYQYAAHLRSTETDSATIRYKDQGETASKAVNVVGKTSSRLRRFRKGGKKGGKK